MDVAGYRGPTVTERMPGSREALLLFRLGRHKPAPARFSVYIIQILLGRHSHTCIYLARNGILQHRCESDCTKALQSCIKPDPSLSENMAILVRSWQLLQRATSPAVSRSLITTRVRNSQAVETLGDFLFSCKGEANHPTDRDSEASLLAPIANAASDGQHDPNRQVRDI